MKFRTQNYDVYVFFLGQLYAQNLHSRPEVLSTNEGPSETDDSYLGYSVAVGSFGFGYESGAAVGMPRGEQLLGKVKITATNARVVFGSK